MRLDRARWATVAAAAVAAAATAAAPAQVHHVDDDAAPGGDGASWETAYPFLQDALAAAVPGDEVRVAQGAYRPDRDESNPPGTGDRAATFQLPDAVSVLGGYAGLGAPEPDERDVDLHETILSGDLLGNDLPGFVNYDENSHHVVTGSGTGPTTRLEGFTITAGNANGAPWPAYGQIGAGMINDNGSPTVGQCLFELNWSRYSGGGMEIMLGSSPTITGCVFDDNLVSPGAPHAFGAAIDIYADSEPSIVDCLFSNNLAQSSTASSFAGGIHTEAANPTVVGCVFDSNEARYGAALRARASSSTVLNCVFTANAATTGGGAIQSVVSASTAVLNCVFKDNTAGTNGGAIASSHSSSLRVETSTLLANAAPNGGAVRNANESTLLMTNSIAWGNTADQIVTEPDSTSIVAFSDVQGGYSGTGNIDADPMCDVDGHLQTGSPCIDAGATNAVPADGLDMDDDGDTSERLPLDLAGNPRFADDPDTADTGCGEPVKVDMGAYELQGTPVHPVLIGDVDGDGDVAFGDLLLVLASWGECDPACCPADQDFSSQVDFADLLLVLAGWS
jgi:predicted outer membrane repeat protein